VKNRTEFYLLRSSRKSRKRAVSSLRYVKIFTYHFSVTWKYLTLRKIFTYVFAKRKMLTLRHVTLRYV